MRKCRSFLPAVLGVFLPIAALAAREGTPFYYQGGFTPVQPMQTSGGNIIVGQRHHMMQVPRMPENQPVFMPGQFSPFAMGTMTPNGIGALPVPDWQISGGYTRRYADFEFKTGVNSILKWNDMIIDELGVRIDHNFNVRGYDLFAFGEYARGTVRGGGLSMDYDLKPYDERHPNIGIFTISMGDQSGNTDYLRFGFGARNIWDVAGWKLSPSIGYEVFNHNLRMSNHIYPNPAIYLPLMTQWGDYVFGDTLGNFFSVPIHVTPQDDWYQVCLSPEDIAIVFVDQNGQPAMNGGMLVTGPWDPAFGNIPWGVGPGDCVIIGGDGAIKVRGTTHIYNTTWSGIYLGLGIEKQMTFADKLRFYLQVSMPHYFAEGIWPNRTDWQQHPSFIDEGSNGSYSYQFEAEYTYRLSERLQLSLKADTRFFHVGQIPGELYVASFVTYQIDQNGHFIYTDHAGAHCDPSAVTGCFPTLIEVPAHTVRISDALKYARWQTFGLHLGLRYAF